MTKLRQTIALAAILPIAACATPTQPFLDAARSNCAAGIQASCAQVPSLQAQVNAERDQQAQQVGAALLIGLGAAAVGAAAGYAASHPAPTEVYVVCRPWWSC